MCKCGSLPDVKDCGNIPCQKSIYINDNCTISVTGHSREQNSCIGYPICLKIKKAYKEEIICMDGQSAKNLICVLLETLG